MLDANETTERRLPGTSPKPLQLLLIAAGLIVGAALVWALSGVLMLVFGAILIGILLGRIADFIDGWTGMGRRPAVLLTVLVLLALAGVFALLLGAQLLSEFNKLVGQLPKFITMIENNTGITDLEEWLETRGQSLVSKGPTLGSLTGISAALLSTAVNLLIVAAGGIYLAANPRPYRHGLLLLLPPSLRERGGEVLTDLARALRYWIAGQLLSMLCIGVLTTSGLLILGVTPAIALGFLAGLLEFVPYVGPIASAIPAVAVGLAEGPATAAWVVGLYFVVQQVEAALITPLVQKRAVSLPPALTIFAIFAFGALLGPGGIVLGTPLAVVTFTLVNAIWIKPQSAEKPSQQVGSD